MQLIHAFSMSKTIFSMNAELQQTFERAEVNDDLRQMTLLKSLSLDGFRAGFY